MIQKDNSRKQKIKRLLAVLLAFFAIYVCFGIWGVPAIVRSQTQKIGSELLGRDLTVEKVTFNPFTFETRLYNMEVGPANGDSQQLLKVAKISVNPQIVSVFGTVTLKSVVVEEGDLWVKRDESGSFSFDDILNSFASNTEEKESDAESELVSAIVNTLSLRDLSIHFTDTSMATDYLETVTISKFSGQDIGTVEKDELLADGTGTPVFHWKFDGLVETGSGSTTRFAGGATSISPWALRVETDLQAFPIDSLQPYIDEQVALKIKGRLSSLAQIDVRLVDDLPEMEVNAGVALDDFSASDDAMDYLSFDTLSIQNLVANPNDLSASIGSIVLSGPKVSAKLLADRSPKLPELKGMGAMGNGEVLSSASEEKAVLPAFKATLGEFRIEDGVINIEDGSLSEPFVTELNDLSVVLSDLVAQGVQGKLEARAAGSMTLRVIGGLVAVDGELTSLGGVASANVEVKGLQLKEIEPYFAEYSNVKVSDGTLSVNLKANTQSFDDPNVSGSVRLSDLKVQETKDDHEVLFMKSMVVDGIDATTKKVNLSLVRLEEPILTVWQSPEGLNLSRLQKRLEQEPSGEEMGAESSSVMQQDFPVEVNLETFELLAGGVDFVDTDLLSTHRSRISDFDIKVSGITTDPEKVADYAFSGKIDENAKLEGAGKVSAADPEHYLDLDVTFSGYDLKSTSPYWETYLGRSLGKGRFEIHSAYEVRDSQLKGKNDFRIDQLTLGSKVESDRAMNLPVGFAIKLMQDPSGLIAYEGLPVEGDLSDPQVRPWGLVGRAIRNLVLNAATAPFKFLAGMVGGREDLDTIVFAAGDLELNEDAREKIDALRKILQMRPGITLEMTYVTDPQEITYLKDQYLRHLIANPDFEPLGGIDILYPVDEIALKANVEQEYSALLAAQQAEEMQDLVSSSEVLEKVENTPAEPVEPKVKQKRSLFGKIVGVFGFGKKSPQESEVDLEPMTEVVESEGVETDSSETVEVSFEEKLAAVLATHSEVESDPYWVEDLAVERIQNFKEALFEGEDIDGARVFVVDPSDFGNAKLQVGALHLKLSS